MNKVQTIELFNEQYDKILDYSAELGVDQRDIVPTLGIYQNLDQYLHVSFQSYLSLLDSELEYEIINKVINKDTKHIHSVLNHIKENELEEYIKLMKYDDDSQYEILDSFDAFANDVIKIKEQFDRYQLNPNTPFYIDQDSYQITSLQENNLKEIVNKGIENLKQGIIDYNDETSELIYNKYLEIFVNQKLNNR